MLSAEQVAAVKAVQKVCSKKRIVLIGASALGCFLDIRWRQTYDLDLSISASIEECASNLARLRDWTPDSRFEQRWLAPGGVRIDIIPAGPELLAAGEIVWPKSGNHMSLVGLRLAFENNERFQVVEGVDLRVPQFLSSRS